MLGVPGLKYEYSRVDSTGTSGDLNHGLGQALRRPEIRTVEQLIGIQHHRQGNAGQMVTLGQHLGADQDAGAIGVDLRQVMLECILAAHGIAIEAQHPDIRKSLLQCRLESFGAGTDGLQRGRAAIRAASRQGLGSAAMVADQASRVAMPGQVGAAFAAFAMPAAFVTGQHRRVAAPVAIDQYLAPLFQSRLDPFQQRRTEAFTQ